MTVAANFARFQVDQPVDAIVGEGDHRMELSGRVAYTGGWAVELALNEPPPAPERLTPGAAIQLRASAHRLELGHIVDFATLPEPVMLVEPAATVIGRDNRRRHRRIATPRLSAYLLLSDGQSTTSMRARLLDLSAGGARLLLTRTLPAGIALEMRLPLAMPGGQIVWAEQLHRFSVAGVQFVGLATAESELLERALFVLRFAKAV
jgi:hypothetical protein